MHIYQFSNVFTVFFGIYNAKHLSFQEPNLSHERSTQSTIAFLSFPGFYSPFKAGEVI